MTKNIEEKIEDLKSWARADLLAEWKRLIGFDAPKSLSIPLLIRVISYKWQEEVYGCMSPADQRLLDRMVAAYERDPSKLQPDIQIKTGTRLRRLYQGKVHEVTSANDGFIYDGRSYRSLSEVARHITGTRWNGRIFFGLKPKASPSKRRGIHEQASA